MKVKISEVICEFNGTPMKMDADNDLTVGDAFVIALNNATQKDAQKQEHDMAAIVARADLSFAIQTAKSNGDDAMTLRDGDVKLLKERIPGAFWNQAILASQLDLILDGKSMRMIKKGK